MNAKIFPLSSVFFIVSLLAIYFGLFHFQQGERFPAEYWIKNIYTFKEDKAQKIEERKILIISGSNSLFGINSELLSNRLNTNVVNLSSHAILSLDFLLYKIKNNMNEGDIVVMPLEFNHYTKTSKLPTWFSDNMMAWGEDYISQLPLRDHANLIRSSEPTRVFEGVLQMLVSKPRKTKIYDIDKIQEDLTKEWEKSNWTWNGYSHTSLNDLGDFNVKLPVKYKKNHNYFKKGPNPSPHFIEKFNSIKRLISKRKGTLILTFPVTIRHDNFNLSNENHIAITDTLIKNLNDADIEIHCNPALFNLDRSFFFDTFYHPNILGSLINSENLAYCISNIENKNFNYKASISRTKKLEARLKKYVSFDEDLREEIDTLLPQIIKDGFPDMI